jgi:hypothetical protein
MGPYPLRGSQEAVTVFDAAVERWLHHDGGVLAAARDAVQADPSFAAGHALLAMVSPAQASSALADARRLATRCAEHERSFVGMVDLLVGGGMWVAQEAVLAHARAYPADLFGVGLAATIVERSTRADVQDAVRAVYEPSRRLLGEHPYLLAMLGFVDQEQGRFAEAGQKADTAMAAVPTSVTAAHLRAHVNVETAAHADGLAWLDAFRARMAADSDYRHHMGWHAALHALALGDERSTLARLSALGPPQTDAFRQVVDTGTLLARCRICGLVGPDEDPTDGRAGTPDVVMLAEPASMYVAFHVAVGLAVQGRADDLRDLARRGPTMAAPGLAELLPPLALALDDVEGVHARAAEVLVRLRPTLHRWGGSRAQREVVEDLLIDAALRGGRVELARTLLRERLERRPNRWDAAALATGVWHPVP